MEKKKGKAIVVGGSIAGLSCAHSLTLAGWDVLVLEKSSEPPTRSPTGAGLGLDSQVRQIIKSWLPHPHLLDEITLPLSIDQGNSVTMKVSQEMINKMHQEAETIWILELARLMKETNDPFLNVIYDCDPLERFFWGNVVLVGDAVHPTTPHGLRSTNMSVLDAEVLGKCLEKCGPENLSLGLEEYQRIRLPVVAEQVLYARRLGRVKQGRGRDGTGLEQRNMPFFSSAPFV